MPTQRLLPALLVLPACLIAERTVEKIGCQDLPTPVQAAAAKQKAKPGTETSCEKIKENGETLYEVKVIMESGKMRETVYQPNGKITEFEDESDLAAIPPAARTAIEKAVGAGELLKVDVIHRGRMLLYEGEYRQDGAKKKVIVDAAGRAISK